MAVTTLEKVKSAIGIRISNTKDDEITDLISSCKKDLEISGISFMAINEEDSQILLAIKLYCIANYDRSDPRSLPYENSYLTLVSHLSLSSDYNV